MGMKHEHRSVALHGVIKELQRRGLYEQVHAAVSAPTRAVVLEVSWEKP
jgi:hypothetical protein